MEQKKKEFEQLSVRLDDAHAAMVLAENNLAALLQEKMAVKAQQDRHQEEWQQVKDADLRLAHLEQEKSDLAAKILQMQDLLEIKERKEQLEEQLIKNSRNMPLHRRKRKRSEMLTMRWKSCF